MPKVSVVIPTYNYAQYIEEAIDSALVQTHKGCEIIVVDDGSTDDTKGVVSQYRSEIRYIYQKNQGLSAARNTGVRNSEGEYIAILDSDDLWLPSKIEKQIKLFEANSRLGLVYSDGLVFGEELAWNDLSFGGNMNFYRGRIFDKLLLGNFIPCPSVVIKRGCFDKVGLFDINLGACEDWDMSLRISSHYEVDYVEELLVKHRKHRGSMETKAEMMEENALKVLDKIFLEKNVPSILKRKAYSNAYLNSGGLYRNARKLGKSRSRFFKSLLLYPFSFTPWVSAAKSLVVFERKGHRGDPRVSSEGTKLQKSCKKR